MALYLEDDRMCYVCGLKNSKGFRLKFQHPARGRLTAVVTFSKEHQGFKNIVHGGMMAMILDEMMVNLAWKEGIPAVTAELNVRLKKPARIGEKIYFEGRVNEERRKGRVIYAASHAKNEAGEILASASAVCIRMNRDMI